MADTKPKTDEPVYKLKQTRLHIGEAKIRTWFAAIEEKTPYEKLLDPTYWDVHGYKFAMWDFIRCIPDEGNYIAEFVVVGTGVGGIRVQELWKKEIGLAKSEPMASQFTARYAGPHHKWRVERIADKHIESSGFDTEQAANTWLAENLKALSKAAAATKAA